MSLFTFAPVISGHGSFAGYLLKQGQPFGGLNFDPGGQLTLNVRKDRVLTLSELQLLMVELSAWHPALLHYPVELNYVAPLD